MRLLAPFALLLAALGMVVWLDESPPPADLVVVNRNEVFTLDPQRMSWVQDLRMAYALYEPLVRWDDGDFTIQAAAAGEWSASEDGTRYTFTIRPDARWSNGDPVLAADFAYAWRRAIMPDTAGDYSNLFFAIEGAEAFFAWRSARLAELATALPALDAAARSGAAGAAWTAAEARFAETVGVRAAGDRTLVVRLARPLPYFLDLVAFGPFAPVHRPTVEGWVLDEQEAARVRDAGWTAIDAPPFERRRHVRLDPESGRFEQGHGWTKAGRLVSNGPYMLAAWHYRRGMTLVRNPAYHSPELVRSERITCTSYEETGTAVLAFESGQVDWLTDVTVDYQADLLAERARYDARHAAAIAEGRRRGRDVDEILASLPEPGPGERRDIHALGAFGIEFYSFNCRPKLADGRTNPLADPRVRRAFVQSVDRTVIVEQVTRLDEPVLSSFTPPGAFPGYERPEGLGFDPPAARAGLAAAGWVDRDDDGVLRRDDGTLFPVVDLLYSTGTPRYRDISLALRDMWRRELGVRVELRAKESKFFKEDLRRGNFMIARGNWYGDYGDPTTFLNIHRTGDGNNDRGYSSPAVDDLLDRADAERDPRRRLDLLAECEGILCRRDVPLLVLCQKVEVYMYDPVRMRGLSRHPRLVHYLWQLHEAAP